MIYLSASEIEAFVQEMKNGKKLRIAGEYDPDPYGGGTHWNHEMQYDAEKQIYLLTTNFYASQYHTDPEVSCIILEETKVMERLLLEKKHRVSCW